MLDDMLCAAHLIILDQNTPIPQSNLDDANYAIEDQLMGTVAR